MQSLDNESLKKQAIVDFSTRKRTAASSQDKPQKIKEQSEMRQKVERAKVHAQEELLAFRSIIETAKEQLDDLALFANTTDILEEIFIMNILESMVEPIIKGDTVPFMSEESIKETRKMMFKDLIQKYEKE